MEQIKKRCSALNLKNQIKTVLNNQGNSSNNYKQKQHQFESTRSPPNNKQNNQSKNPNINITTFDTQIKENKKQNQNKQNINLKNEVKKQSSLSTKSIRNKFDNKLKYVSQDNNSRQLKILKQKKKLKIVKLKPQFHREAQTKNIALYYKQNNQIIINLNNLGGDIIKMGQLTQKTGNNNQENRKCKNMVVQQEQIIKMFRGQSFSACEQIKQQEKDVKRVQILNDQ